MFFIAWGKYRDNSFGVGISKLDRKWKVTIHLRKIFDDVTTQETGNWKGP